MILTDVISLLGAREVHCRGPGAAGEARVEVRKDP